MKVISWIVEFFVAFCVILVAFCVISAIAGSSPLFKLIAVAVVFAGFAKVFRSGKTAS